MVKIAVADSTSEHTGTVCAGPVAGTVTPGTNAFAKIKGQLIMVDDGTLEVPSHLNPPCTPGTPASHSFTPNTFQQTFAKVNGRKMVLVGDSFSGDATNMNGAGSNNIADVTP